MFHTNLLSLVKIRPVGAPKRDQHSFPLSFSEYLIVKLNFKKTEKIKPFALTRFQCYLFNVFLFFIVFTSSTHNSDEKKNSSNLNCS